MEFGLANFQCDAFRDSAAAIADAFATMNATQHFEWAQAAIQAMLLRIAILIELERAREQLRQQVR
jgi:hypothetical protein